MFCFFQFEKENLKAVSCEVPPTGSFNYLTNVSHTYHTLLLLREQGPLESEKYISVCLCKSRENHFPGTDNQPNVHNKKSCLVWSDTKLLLLVFSALCILKNLIQKNFLGLSSYAKTLSGNQMSYSMLLKSH